MSRRGESPRRFDMPQRSSRSSVVLGAFLLALPGTLPAERPVLVVHADPCVELVGIVFRLAGRPEYGFPAVGNAIMDACGADLSDNPATPERVWRALKD